MQKWFNGFTPQQERFHKELIRKIVQDSNEKTEIIIDSCYIGAMLEYLEIELKDCVKIAEIANRNMEETSQYLNKEKGYYDMLKDEKLRSQIRDLAVKMLIQGQVMSNGVVELKKEYKLPVKDLSIIWAEAKEELKKSKEADKELKEIIKKHKPKEELPYVVTEKEIEASREITVDKIEFKEPNKLEILNITIEVKGEYSTYKKDSQGVYDGNKTFKDIEDLKNYKNDIEGDFNKNIEHIKQQINNFNEELLDLESLRNKRLNKIAETELVFNM